MFDEAAEAAGKQYFRLGAMQVSPDGRYAATLVDDNGSERFKLRIREIATGRDVETVTEVGIGAPVWTADSRAIVFTEVNENWRSYRARLHRLGQPVASDRTLYEETQNIAFTVDVGRTQDRRYILISTGENSSNEVRFVPADNPEAPPVLIAARRPLIQYSVDSSHGKFWILTNDDHVNFRIAEADPAHPGDWHTIIAGSDAVYLRGITAFRDHLAITERVTASIRSACAPMTAASATSRSASRPTRSRSAPIPNMRRPPTG